MTTEKPTPLRRRKSGDIGQLKRVLWGSLLELEAIVLSVEDAQVTVKACHALGTLAGAYLRALEQSDIIDRVTALEEAIAVQEKDRVRWSA